MFCYDRRESYYDAQDIAPDHRYALMRWSGRPDDTDIITLRFDRMLKRTIRYFGRNPRPDRKRQKKGHR